MAFLYFLLYQASSGASRDRGEETDAAEAAHAARSEQSHQVPAQGLQGGPPRPPAGTGRPTQHHEGLQSGQASFTALYALTNEKRGGLDLVPFDWPRFKLFRLKFSKESVLTSSCKSPKTVQRTLCLSFETNNC
jgi:hypothetical protein